MVGIVAHGAYIPIYRFCREEIGEIWGTSAGKGERSVANYDEDSLIMGAEAAINCLIGLVVA